MDGIRKAIVGAILFMFAVGAYSRLITAKDPKTGKAVGPGLISGAGDLLSNLFTNARS